MSRRAFMVRRQVAVLFLLGLLSIPVGLPLGSSALAAVPSPGSTASNDVEKLLSDARAALKQGQPRLALLHLRNATRRAPGNAAAQVLLSQILMLSGDASGAEKTLRDALRADAPENVILPSLLQVMLVRGEYTPLLEQFPDPGTKATPVAADILKARAFALQGTSRPTEANAAIDRSLKLRKDSQGLLAKAHLAEQQRDSSTARSFADQAVQSDPNNTNAALLKIKLLRASNENAAALDLANKLLARVPENLPAKLARVEIFLSQKEDQKAKSEIDALLTQRPNLPQAVFYRAVLLQRAGRPTDAWIAAQNLPTELLTSDPRLGITVAKIALGAGKANVGDTILGRVVGRWPDSVTARLELASLRLGQGSPNGALSALEPLVNSTDPAVVSLLARAYTDLDRKKDAAAALQRLKPPEPGVEAETRRQAMEEMRKGRAEVAIKLLTPLVAKGPVNPSLAAPLIGALIEMKRFAEAINVADRLGADPKQKVLSLIYKGDIFALQKNMVAARTAFDQAVAISPKNKAAFLSRANFFSAVGRFPEAEKDLRQAAALDTKDYSPLLRLAAISARQGQDQKTRLLLQKAIDVAPQDATPRLTMAGYLLDRRDTGAAFKVANDLARAQPSNADAFALKGRVELEMGKPRDAVGSFRRFATLDSDSGAAQMMLGKALAAAGDQPGAAAAMGAAVKLNPRSPEIKSAQIDLMIAQGKTAPAISEANAFRAANPGVASDLILSNALVKAGRSAEAAGVLEKRFSTSPDSATLSRLVQVLYASKEDKKAKGAMAEWLNKNPGDIAMRLQYADFLMRGNEPAKAREQYEAILKLDPNNLMAANNLSWLIQGSDPKRAMALILRAEKLSPNSADIADTAGLILLRQKDAAGALKHGERAYALRPGDDQIAYHYAAALNANAKRDQARAILKKLLAKNTNNGVRADAQQLYDSLH